MDNELSQNKSKPRSLMEVLLVSTKLGLTSFGGPIAHLGYFHNEYIKRRKWMDERSYADLVALCQFLPTCEQPSRNRHWGHACRTIGRISCMGWIYPSFRYRLSAVCFFAARL